MRWLTLLVVVLWVTLWTADVGTAMARARIERAAPAPNAVLSQSPRQIEIVFSEELEARFREIAVWNAGGRRVETGPLRASGGQRRALALDVPTLADATYTVSWKTFSAIDGQTAAGSYRFAVGVGQSPEASTLTAATQDGASPEWVFAVIRWLTYLSTAVLIGVVPYVCWIAAPVLRSAPSVGAASRRLAAVAAAVAIVVGVLGLVVQAMHASGPASFAALGTYLAALLTTRYGQLWLDRMVMTMILALLVGWGRIDKPSRRPHRLLAVLAAVGILGALILNGHAAATQTDQALAMALALVHLVGMAVWVGGLAHLLPATLVLTRDRRPGNAQVLGRLIDRFTPFATVSVVALVGSGLYQSLVQVQSFEALVVTPYGQTLVWKLGLLALMLVVGLLKTVVMPARIRMISDPVQDRRAVPIAVPLRWLIGAEVALGVLVLAMTGLLWSQEPAREALARMTGIVDVTEPVDDLHVRLTVSMPTAGVSAFVAAQQDAGDGHRSTLRSTCQSTDPGRSTAWSDETAVTMSCGPSGRTAEKS